MGPGDQAILVTHQPRWLSDWFWDETACHNLRQLVRGHLQGRARVHLAGQFNHSIDLPMFSLLIWPQYKCALSALHLLMSCLLIWIQYNAVLSVQ